MAKGVHVANRRFKQVSSLLLESAIVKLYGEMTIGSAGAISSSQCQGFSIALTDSEAGRYTVTLNDSYYAMKGCQISLVGPADAAITSAGGIISFVRNDDVNGAKTFDIQFASNVDLVDADLESGIRVLMEITLKNSSQEF